MISIYHVKADVADETIRDLMLPMNSVISECNKIVASPDFSPETFGVVQTIKCLARKQARQEIAIRLFKAGDYEKVAEFSGDDVHLAYKLTQNGAASASWSLAPADGLVPTGERVIIVGGQSYGRRSTTIGDIFEADGRFYIVGDGNEFPPLVDLNRTVVS